MALRASLQAGLLNQSSAQVIEGSLKFDGSKPTYLKRTFGAGNQKTWTWSAWVRRDSFGERHNLFGVPNTDANGHYIEFRDTDRFQLEDYASGVDFIRTLAQSTRDNGWIHWVVVQDTTQSDDNNKVRIYKNGELQTDTSALTHPSLNEDGAISRAAEHRMGVFPTNETAPFDGAMAQVYFIDGQGLGPEYFGFTDGLTNVWRPKKYTGTYTGTNTFYLPFDGNSPIGQDKSGNGNDWTLVNFNGTVGVDKASGALPILEGAGGAVANVGVRTDSFANNLILAMPLVGIHSDRSNDINSVTAIKGMGSTQSVPSTTQTNLYGGSYYFDGSNDLISSSSSDYGFASGTAFTIEGWFYASSLASSADGSGSAIFGNRQLSQSNSFTVYIGSSATNTIGVHVGSGTVTYYNVDGGLSTNRWYHIAMVRNTSNVVEFFVNGVSVGTGTPAGDLSYNGFYIGCYGDGRGAFFTGYIQDFRIYNGAQKYTSNFTPASTDPDILPDSPSGASGNLKLAKITDGSVSFAGGDRISLASSSDFNLDNTWTIEFYYYNMSSTDGRLYYFHNNTNNIQTASSGTQLLFYNGSTATTFGKVGLNKWHHIAIVNNAGSVTIYIDGYANGSATAGAVSADTALTIGAYSDGQNPFKGYISNFRVINGTALYTSKFTPPTKTLTNVTNTKLLCCQSPISATVGAVKPGTITASGDAAAVTFNPFSTNINTVRGQESSYATLNPLWVDAYSATLSNGNLDYSTTVSGNYADRFSSVGVSSGKYYVEFTVGALGNSTFYGVAIDPPYSLNYIGALSTTWSYFQNGNKYNSGSNTSYGAAFVAGDTIGIALDLDAKTLTFYNNGKSQGVAYSSLPDGTYFFGISQTGTASSKSNFGQKPFKFPPPDGFQPLNDSTILPSTVIPNVTQYVGVTTWIGNGTSQKITGYNFKPDFVWCKARTFSADHELYDSVRGTMKRLFTSGSVGTNGQDTPSSGVNSFDSDGFGVTGGGGVNNNSSRYVGWCWKAGGNENTFNVDNVGYSTYTDAPGLTAGTIKINAASVGTKQGFSIINYYGTDNTSDTFSHGLSQKPDLAIFKNMSQNGDDWIVYSSTIGATKRIKLNGDDGADTQTSQFNDTEPTSSLFTIGTYDNINKANNSYIAYLWHSVPGLQKFGGYVGNGLDNGPFIETGFRPTLIWTRVYDGTGVENNAGWFIYDTQNDTNKYNDDSAVNKPGNYILYANLSNDVNSHASMGIDILSNGFRLRADSNGYSNWDGRSYIYAAFAEQPSFNLYGAQSVGR